MCGPGYASGVNRLLLPTAVLSSLLLAGCGAGDAVYDYGQVAQGVKGKTIAVEIGKGQRFSLAVDDNPKAGDAWELVEVPDPKVASYISKEHQEADSTGGSGASRFVFNAKNPGTTTIRLFDCWKCGADRVPADAVSKQYSGEAVFQITVR